MQIYEYLSAIINASLFGGVAQKLPEQVPFEEIVEIANRNHISYMVFSELLRDDSFTDNQLDYMRSVVKASILNTLIQSIELKRMIDEFEKAQVKNLPMKGAVLKGIYPKPELREMSDIDVLIDVACSERAAEALYGMGYELSASIKHHDIYHKGNRMVIEAHKSMYDKTVDNAQHEYFVGFDKAVLRENCEFTYELGTEDFYIFMLAHSAKHFYAMGCGIRNLIDIYVYLKQFRSEMNFDYVESELRKIGLYDFSVHMEKLAFDWLEGRELDEFYIGLFQYMLDSGIYGKDENGIWNKFCNEKKDGVSTLELKLWYYFPPLYYMCEYYPWLDEHPRLLPIAWGIRLFRGLFEHKGSAKRKMVNSIKTDRIVIYKNIYQKIGLQFSRKK